jgi:hypothetical protein
MTANGLTSLTGLFTQQLSDEYGVTRANIDSVDYDANPELGRLFGKNDGGYKP